MLIEISLNPYYNGKYSMSWFKDHPNIAEKMS